MSNRLHLPASEDHPQTIARRDFLIGASAMLVFAPSIVRASSLMPLKGIALLSEKHRFERHYYGFVERLYVHSNLPTIVKLQNAGLSLNEVAAFMNGEGRRSVNGTEWDSQRVIDVIKRDESIRREDAVRRAEAGTGPRGQCARRLSSVDINGSNTGG